MAIDIPVLPTVPSKMVEPVLGCIKPSSSACSTIRNATLSLGDPPGFRYSALPYLQSIMNLALVGDGKIELTYENNRGLTSISHPVISDKLFIRTKGVLPMRAITPSSISSRLIPEEQGKRSQDASIELRKAHSEAETTLVLLDAWAM